MQKIVNLLLLSVLLASIHTKAAEKSAPQPVKIEIKGPTEASVPEEPPEQYHKIVSSPPTQAVAEPEISEKFAINGYSGMGAGYNQGFNIKVAAIVDGTSLTVVDRASDVQFIGGGARYSVIPVGKLGTDFGLTLATSVNHGSLNYAALFATKLEFNLTWAWLLENRRPLYMLFGFAYETVKSADIEKVISPNGGIAQIGVGYVFSKNLNFEGIFAIARHGVSSVYENSLVAAAKAQGSVKIDFDASKSFVTSNIFLGRIVYKF